MITYLRAHHKPGLLYKLPTCAPWKTMLWRNGLCGKLTTSLLCCCGVHERLHCAAVQGLAFKKMSARFTSMQ